MAGGKYSLPFKLLFIPVLFCALCGLSPSSASAQTELTAGVRGQIKAEASGESIPGARVRVKNEALRLERAVTTGGEGEFVVPGLPPGAGYEVSVEAKGFNPLSRGALTLVSGETATLSLALQVHSIAEAVTVTDEAAPVVSNAPEISQVVNARRLAELPSNGRSVNRFALLNPHVRNTGGLGADGSTSARLSINANSFRHTFFKLDGNSNYETVFANAPQQQVGLTAVQEFKVLTNQYSAEYGGSTAGIVSAVTKTGTPQFHGEGFFFLRPSGLQAAPPVSTQHVPNELMQAGGSLGGPLWSDRATFFLSYEHSRQNRGAFIQSPAPLTYTGHSRDHIGLARFDYQLTSVHSMALRVNANRNANDNPNDRVSGFNQPSTAQFSKTQSAGAQFTDRTVWGVSVNELRLNYVNAVPSASSPVTPSTVITRPNYSTEGNSTFSWVRTETWQVADQLARQQGAHDLKLGGDYTRQRVRDFSYSAFGEYRFAPVNCRVGECPPPKPTDKPLDFTQRFGTGFVRYGQTLASAFIQDNWRVTPRLTANLGLRYDHQSITDDRNNFAPRLGLAWDVTGDGKTTLRAGAGVFYDQYYMYITRRFLLEGLNAPFQTFKLDFGAQGFPTLPNSLAAPPNAANPQPRDYVYLPAEKLLNPYNMQFSVGLQRQFFGNWTATLDLIHSRTLKQMRVNDINAPAPFFPTATQRTRPASRPASCRNVFTSPCLPLGGYADETRPFGTRFQGVNVKRVAVIENTATSRYDALDLGLLRRFANRFQFEAHYVYSSALTDSMFFGEPDTGIPAQFRLNDRLEWAPSDFHQRHRFVSHGLVEMPLKTQLSFVATLASGLPVNPVTGDDTNGDGYRTDRPAGFGRNSFRTPAQMTFDASFAKSFPLRETARLELRAEAFNIFNRSNFIKLNNIYGRDAQPLASFLTPVAGIQNSDPGRQLQFGARFIF